MTRDLSHLSSVFLLNRCFGDIGSLEALRCLVWNKDRVNSRSIGPLLHRRTDAADHYQTNDNCESVAGGGESNHGGVSDSSPNASNRQNCRKTAGHLSECTFPSRELVVC